MKRIRLLALLLAILLIAACFAACDSGNGGTDKPDDKPNYPEDPDNGGEDDGGKEDEGKLVINDTFYPKYDNLAKEYKDMKAKVSEWFYKNLEDDTLFSVKLGNDGIDKIKARWTKDVKKGTDENGNETVVATYKDGALVYTLSAVLYSDFPTVDYVIWLENTGEETTEKVSAFNALDASFELPASKGYTVRTSRGSLAEANDFETIEQTISKGKTEYAYGPGYDPEKGTITPTGKSTDGGWPYFNVIGKDCGVMLAVGWTGQWETTFKNETAGLVDFKVYQKNLGTVLLSGEKIRTPSVVFTYYEGGDEYGQNVFRKLVVEHYTYENDENDRFVSPVCANFWGGYTQSYITGITKEYAEAGIECDLAWMDAGWYADYAKPAEGKQTAAGGGNDNWSAKTGWWAVNKALFPSGNFKSLSDVFHGYGQKFLLWYALEDARTGYASKFTLGKDSYYSLVADGDRMLLDLSDDAVLEKVLAMFRQKLDNEGVDCIRIDNGVRHWQYWLRNDKELSLEIDKRYDDLRGGYTENKHIVNYYKLWDTLYAEYPDFELDNCAGGGRKLDVEMTKRSVPLWRTDYDSTDLEAMQAQTQWISYWLPFSAAGVVGPHAPYRYRSLYSSSCSYQTFGVRPDELAALKNATDEFRYVSKYWYGSFYTLLAPDNTKDTWNAYELFREDLQSGMAVIIRRPNSQISTTKIKLKGLISDRTYILHNIDDGGAENDITKTGAELMNDGLNMSASAGSITVYEITISVS